jgi:hypothetical protein
MRSRNRFFSYSPCRVPGPAIIFALPLLVTLLLITTGCARDRYFLEIVPDEGGITIVEDGSGSTAFSIEASIVGTFSEGNTEPSEAKYGVELYVALKQGIQAAFEDGGTPPASIFNETIVVDETFAPTYEFTYEADTSTLESGQYWFEFVWLDDSGYNIIETPPRGYFP